MFWTSTVEDRHEQPSTRLIIPWNAAFGREDALCFGDFLGG
jgi:hypothetical protein